MINRSRDQNFKIDDTLKSLSSSAHVSTAGIMILILGFKPLMIYVPFNVHVDIVFHVVEIISMRNEHLWNIFMKSCIQLEMFEFLPQLFPSSLSGID